MYLLHFHKFEFREENFAHMSFAAIEVHCYALNTASGIVVPQVNGETRRFPSTRNPRTHLRVTQGRLLVCAEVKDGGIHWSHLPPPLTLTVVINPLPRLSRNNLNCGQLASFTSCTCVGGAGD